MKKQQLDNRYLVASSAIRLETQTNNSNIKKKIDFPVNALLGFGS